MNKPREIGKIEKLLKSELLIPSKNPGIEQGLSMVIKSLSPAKSLYGDALEILQKLRSGVNGRPEEEDLDLGIEAARCGYIAVDQIIGTLFDIRETLRMAPVNLFFKKRT